MQVEDAYDMLAAVAAVARLRYPIETAERLVEQLPPGDLSATVDGAKIDLKRVARALPANYFPVTSLENLAAKAEHFLRENEHRIGAPRGLAAAMKRVADAAHFPIHGVADLRRATETAGVAQLAAGARVNSVEALLGQARHEMFPITNARALYRLGRQFARR